MFTACKILVVLAAMGSSVCAAAQNINLICDGAGSANKMDQSHVELHSKDDGIVSGTTSHTAKEQFADQTRIHIQPDGISKILLPRILLPLLHGGENGWFQIKDLQLSDTQIAGSVQLNILNSPKIRIDRMTGAFSLNGKVGSFSGKCRPYDPEKQERQF